ncbi:MAG: epoxyqueuosine reductase QueH [Chitinivibrionales bacterium]|nr:epoxyqueuosine reductase QueH [Chitinivibrionales bacterium]
MSPDKTKLVLHVCCAPDEAAVVAQLGAEYSLHCFFCNPNIAPSDEYHKRLDEARLVALKYVVDFSADEYEPQSWEAAITGLEQSGEGGERCKKCFELRLMRTAAFCKQIGCARFTTVMSISPHKNIAMLNAAGTSAALRYGVTYEPFNFKKNDGFLKSIRLSKELGLYRQDYCGCRLSRAERDTRIAARPAGGLNDISD